MIKVKIGKLNEEIDADSPKDDELIIRVLRDCQNLLNASENSVAGPGYYKQILKMIREMIGIYLNDTKSTLKISSPTRQRMLDFFQGKSDRIFESKKSGMLGLLERLNKKNK